MEYFTRLRRFWFPDLSAFLWLLLALPALYFFQTTVHEGTHGLTAFFSNGDFPKVAPFPHLTSAGNFLNGVTIPNVSITVTERTDCNDTVPSRPNRRLAGFIAMPQFVDLILVVAFTLIFLFWNIRNQFVAFLLRTWYLGACIDFMFNTARALFWICNDLQDWSRFMIRSDINQSVFGVMTWLFWLLILCHFVWVYWSKWGTEELDATNFWDFRWIAFILGTLSLFAVLLSLIVSDNNIDKGSAAFIVPFIVQILALCWYWIYFGLTFKYSDSASAS